MKSQAGVEAPFRKSRGKIWLRGWKAAQAGVELMFITSALLLILLSVTLYSYYISQDLGAKSIEVDAFKSCSLLQTHIVSAAILSQNKTAVFLDNWTIHNRAATTFRKLDVQQIPFACNLLVPTNGSVYRPSSWTPPINATLFYSRDGEVNITWGYKS